VGVEYSPFDPKIHEDPFPVYARLLEEAPVYHNDKDDFWALTRHADVSAALADSTLFSSSHGPLLDSPPWGPDASRAISFVAMDPPEHTRLRAPISRVFTARRVAAMEPRVRDIARRHLEDALAGGGVFDFVEDFAARLPLDVISEVVGVPEGDRDMVRRLAETSLRREEGTQTIPEEGRRASAELTAYYGELLAERRRRPADDLASELAAELPAEEAIPILFVLLAAGSETTTHLLGHAWYWAWAHPGVRERAFADIPAWINETLRYDPPAIGVARLLTRDLTLHGTRIPAGSRMWLVIAAANRDPRVFPHPDRYDLDRDTTQMISFSGGRHYCPGAALGRLEARVALEELAAAVTDYKIDTAGMRRTNIGNVRGFSCLPTMVTIR